MPSAVQIANRALTKLGDERITALTDPTKPARELNSMFDLVRDEELRRHRWKFAIKRSQLTADVTAPDWGFQYAYTLPTDYLGIVQVNDFYVRPYSKQQMMWSIERGADDTRKLMTDLTAPLKVRYISRVENPGLFDVLFAECLACKLALEACEALGKGNVSKDSVRQEYQFAMTEAMRCDAIENPPDELPWGSWLESREGPGGSLNVQDQSDYSNGFTVV